MNKVTLSKPIHLLLVEDNPGDVRLAQEALKDGRIQNELHVVGDGEEALAYLRRQGGYADAVRPDMMLLDLNLPKIDGFEVLAQVRHDPTLQDIPVVILTSSKAQESMLKTYNLDVRCFIQKPLDVERYLEAVRCFDQFGLSIVHVAAAG